MNKARLKNILIALLVTLTLFSVFKYIYSIKEKYELLNILNQTKEQAAALENEKQNLLQELEKEKELQQKLSQENSAFKDSIRLSEEKLAQLDADFVQAQKTIEQLNSNFSLLKAENIALIEKKNTLNTKLSQVSQEKDALQVKLSSIAELKKAIKELKRQMRKVGTVIREKIRTNKIIEGNRGFLIKDGKFTYPAKVKIEVTPASTEE